MEDIRRVSDRVWRMLAAGYAGVRADEDVAVTVVQPDPRRAKALRSAAAALLGREVDAPHTYVELCPDPIAFAVEAGLPAPWALSDLEAVESTWHELAPVPEGPITSISRIASVAECVAADGARLVRVEYQTRFTSMTGDTVGLAVASGIRRDEAVA